MGFSGGAAAIGLGFILSFKAFGLSNIDKAGKKLKDLDKSGGLAVKSLNALRRAAQVGAGLLAIGGAATAAFSVASKKASDFEYAMAEVNTLIQKQYNFDFPKLKEAVMDYAVTAGQKPVEMAKAMYQVISAGIQDQAMAEHALKKAAEAAVAGVSDTLTAVDALTSSLNAFGLKAKYAGDEVDNKLAKKISKAMGVTIKTGEAFDTTQHIFDTFFVAIREGKITFDELNEGLGRVVPLAANLGMSLTDLMGTTSALTKVGLRTSEAYVGLRSMMTAIEKQVGHTRLASWMLGYQFDINSVKTKGWTKFIVGLGKRIREFAGPAGMQRLTEILKRGAVAIDETGKKMKHLSPNELEKIRYVLDKMKNGSYDASEMIFMLMGRVEGANAASALFTDNGKIFIQMMEQMGNTSGATSKAFAKMSETVEMSKKRISILSTLLQTRLGNVINELILPHLKTLEQTLKDINNWMEENPGTVKYIVKLTVLAGVIALVTGGALLLLSVIGTMAIALSAVAAPIIGVVAAFSALAIAMSSIGLFSDDFSNNFSKIKDTVTSENVVDFILEKWKSLKSFFGGFWEVFSNSFHGVFDELKPVFFDLWNSIKGVFSSILDAWKTIFGGKTESTAESIGQSFGKWAGFLARLGLEIIINSMSVLADIISGLTPILKVVFATIFEIGKVTFEVFKTGFKTLTTVFWSLLGFFDSLWDGIKTHTLAFWDVLVGIFIGNLDKIKLGFQSIKEWWGKLFGGPKEQGSLAHGFLVMIDSILDSIRGFKIEIPGLEPMHPFSVIPRLSDYYAEGGLVNRPTVTMVGEDGPELIIPLKKLEMEGTKNSNGIKFENIQSVGSIQQTPKVNNNVNLEVSTSDIITATDKRNILALMSMGSGLHYSWHGVG